MTESGTPVPGEGSGAGPPAGAGRLVGVDAARGLALVGMMTVHVLPAWDPETYVPTLQWRLFSGQAAALFALLAGVGLAFSSGGRSPRRGRAMTADRAGLLVRAVLITAVGLLVNQLLPEDAPAYNILVYYGVFFLLAVPVLHLPARVLLVLAGAASVVGPVLIHALRDVLPAPGAANPVLADAAAGPGTVLAQVLLTGSYPAVAYLAYLFAGMALGRLDLRAPHVQGWLVGAGTVLAAGAWLVYWALVDQGRGRGELLGSTPRLTGTGLDVLVVWGPQPELPTTTWWWLLTPGPHSNTPVSVLQDLGTGVAVLGVLLLLTRASGAWALPLRAMGSMTLTLYSAHLLLLGSDARFGGPEAELLVHVGVAVLVAVLWRRRVGQGPVEHAVAAAVRAVRGIVLRTGERPGRHPG